MTNTTTIDPQEFPSEEIVEKFIDYFLQLNDSRASHYAMSLDLHDNPYLLLTKLGVMYGIALERGCFTRNQGRALWQRFWRGEL